MITEIIDFLIFILPCYIANATPVVLKNAFPFKTPIDLRKRFLDGRRVLGEGKTYEGFISGVLVGSFIGLLLTLLGLHTVYGSIVLSIGAMLGDCIGSFIKRRLGVPRGKPLPLVDQLTFVITALLLYNYLIAPVRTEYYVLSILITLPLHVFTNWIAYIAKLKEVPW